MPSPSLHNVYPVPARCPDPPCTIPIPSLHDAQPDPARCPGQPCTIPSPSLHDAQAGFQMRLSPGLTPKPRFSPQTLQSPMEPSFPSSACPQRHPAASRSSAIRGAQKQEDRGGDRRGPAPRSLPSRSRAVGTGVGARGLPGRSLVVARVMRCIPAGSPAGGERLREVPMRMHRGA